MGLTSSARNRLLGKPVTGVYFLPVLAVLSVIYIYPVIYTFWLVFQKTKFFVPTGFAGGANVLKLFTDEHLITNLFNTLRFATGTLLISLPAGLFAAMLVQRTTKMGRVARGVLLLPWLMSQATAGTIWFWFLNPQYGPVSHFARSLGVDKLIIFSNANLAMIALIVITAWWSYPQSMLFFLGALQTVPRSLKETVLIDGGGPWTSFWNVTFPFIRNSAVTVAIVLLMLYCQMVTMILVTTSGGPIRSTETMSMRVFNQLFTDFNLSGAASSAVLLFVINLVLTLIVINLRRKETIV